MNNLVENLPNIHEKNEVCAMCQLGKQNKLPFPPKATWKASKKLQLVHSDVCAPISTPSLNDSKYFLLFIDDLTRMCWCSS